MKPTPEPGGDVGGEGAAGPPSHPETEEEEGWSLMEEANALLSTSEVPPGCAAGEPASADTREDEGAPLVEGEAAPSGASEAAAQPVAGDSAEKAQKRVRLFGAEELG